MYKPNANIILFLHFVIERQNVFMRKASMEQHPWTDDPLLTKHKFTNVYRFLDWESQFLIREVIGDDNRSSIDTAFRILLFKTLNLSTTWQRLESELGEINFTTSLKAIEGVLDRMAENGEKVFSSAYLQASNFVQRPEYRYLIGERKHHQYLTVFGKELFSLPMLMELLATSTLEKLCTLLQTVNGVGNFMSYQFAQDLNYSKHFQHDMSSHVEEGPGSIRGVKRCFPTGKNTDFKGILKWVHTNLDELMAEHGMAGEFRDFNGHRMGLPDVQNCFCESDKYMRGMGLEVEGVSGKTIKQKYDGRKRRTIDKYVAPPKWGIPELIC